MAETLGNRSRETAQLAPLGRAVRGRVSLGKGSAWYGLVVPLGQNTLRITLAGDPSVRVRSRLENEAGERVPLREVEVRPAEHVLEAVVEPGSSVLFEIFEPPRDVLFTWDTSGGVIPYVAIIYQSLSVFAEDVEPGREEVNLLPFGGRPLLEDWTGHGYRVQGVLNEYPRTDDSSHAEKTLMLASEERGLRPRPRGLLSDQNRRPSTHRARGGRDPRRGDRHPGGRRLNPRSPSGRSPPSAPAGSYTGH